MTAKNKIIAFVGCSLVAAMAWVHIQHYSLWDDEANTALFAITTHETGDTDARYGNNLIAFRKGAELNADLKARYVSPLQYYFLAGFVQPQSPVSARLPFALLTLLTIMIIYRFLIHQRFQTVTIGAF